MNKILAVVVTYNRLEKLNNCIEHLFAQSVDGFDILVVDNASDDGTRDYLCGLYAAPFVQGAFRAVALEKNTGGAGGFHFGMRYAIIQGYEYCWVMDDDCYPSTEALSELLKADLLLKKQGADYGFLSSLVLWKDGNICKMNRVKWQGRYYEELDNIPRQFICSAEQASFVSMFLKTETIRKVGLPIKEFFIWGDDIEFSRRIAVRNRIPSFFVPSSIVFHDTKNNDGSDISKEMSPAKLNLFSYAYRNENYLYRQEGIKGKLYYAAKCLYHIAKVFTGKGNLKKKKIFIIINGVKTGKSFNPNIEGVFN